MDIQSQIIDILADELGIEKERITIAAKIVDDLGADSLDTVEIIQRIEEKFNISIPTEEAGKIKTVKDMLDHLSAKLKK